MVERVRDVNAAGAAERIVGSAALPVRDDLDTVLGESDFLGIELIQTVIQIDPGRISEFVQHVDVQQFAGRVVSIPAHVEQAAIVTHTADAVLDLIRRKTDERRAEDRIRRCQSVSSGDGLIVAVQQVDGPGITGTGEHAARVIGVIERFADTRVQDATGQFSMLFLMFVSIMDRNEFICVALENADLI